MDTPMVRGLWLAYAVLLSVVIGVAGGVLAYLGGDGPAKAIIAGGATFATTVGLAVLVLTFLAGPHPPRRHRSGRGRKRPARTARPSSKGTPTDTSSQSGGTG
jgi:hypothetical protein